MNTKKILFAVAAFGMLALATYVPNSTSEENNQVQKIDRTISGKQIRA